MKEGHKIRKKQQFEAFKGQIEILSCYSLCGVVYDLDDFLADLDPIPPEIYNVYYTHYLTPLKSAVDSYTSHPTEENEDLLHSLISKLYLFSSFLEGLANENPFDLLLDSVQRIYFYNFNPKAPKTPREQAISYYLSWHMENNKENFLSALNRLRSMILTDPDLLPLDQAYKKLLVYLEVENGEVDNTLR